jgi:hypothetical protein
LSSCDVKITEMRKSHAAVVLSVAMLAAASATHADDRLWRGQVPADASTTIALHVVGEEAAAMPARYVWSEQVATPAVPVVALAWRGVEAGPDYALWREQVVQTRGSDVAVRIVRRR